MTIFKDSKDRREFLSRVSIALKESKSQCYAWVLMSNHIHLLIRASESPLSNVMNRVLSGYARAFNKKYKRTGYLYQNRFKSILCQEERYFLELIRYIHLNPVRAGLVKTIEELEKYPYSGHGVISGKNKSSFHEIEEVLLQFSKTRKAAINKYKSFIEDGWAEGKREDLTGGGLRRSAGGWQSILELKKLGDRWQGDDRILGDGAFVEQILKDVDEMMRKQEKLKNNGWNLERLTNYVCDVMEIEKGKLKNKGKRNKLSNAKGMIVYWASKDMGIKGVEIAKHLGIGRSAVNYLMKLGQEAVEGQSLFEHLNNGT